MFIKHKIIINKNIENENIKIIIINLNIPNCVPSFRISETGIEYPIVVPNLYYTDFETWFNIEEGRSAVYIIETINIDEIFNKVSQTLPLEYNRAEVRNVINECIESFRQAYQA